MRSLDRFVPEGTGAVSERTVSHREEIEMRRVLMFKAFAIIVLAADPVSAGIIVDNTNTPSLASQPSSSTLSISQGFTMGGTSEQLGTIAADVNAGAHLALYTEASAHAGPGTLITALTDTGTHNANGDEIYIASTPETLVANHGYAVVMSGNGNTWAETNHAATNVLGVMDMGYNVNEGGGWFEIGSGASLQMQVNTAVSAPEPSSVVMAVLALVFGGARLLCRRYL
jgi:hypothetical protein